MSHTEENDSGNSTPTNGVQNKLTWKHHQWSTVNECWQRIYCHDENDEVDKWDEWSWWNDIDENEDVDEQRVHEEFINGHEWNTVMTYSTLKVKRKHALKAYNHRQEMSRLRKMITSTRGSLHVTDDKTQGIIWRSTHKEETGWMSKSRTRKESLERKPQRDFADKTYDYSIDWRKANLTKMVVLNEIWNKHVWNLVNDCVL